MTKTLSAPTPAQRLGALGKAPRLAGLDLARSLAIFGMVAAHLAVLSQTVVLTDPSTWNSIVHGNSAVLFALLAGFSLTLMTYRDGQVPAKETMPKIRLMLVGRGIAIFLVGLVLEQLGTGIAVILTLYGALYLISPVLVRRRSRTLYLWSALLALLGPVLLALLSSLSLMTQSPGISLVNQQVYSPALWLSMMCLGMALGRLNLRSLKVAASFVGAGLLAAVLGFGTAAFVSTEPPITWSAAAGGSAGSYASSSGSTTPLAEQAGSGKVETGQLVSGAGVDISNLQCTSYGSNMVLCADDMGQAASSTSSAMDTQNGAHMESTWPDYFRTVAETGLTDNLKNALTSATAHSGGTLEALASGGFALMVVGLCLLLTRWIRPVLVPLLAVGSMPLTIYAAHVLALFVAVGPMGGLNSNVFYWWFCAGAVVFACCWKAFFERGPLEAFTRWLGRKCMS